jgi:DNA-binding transcriptional LysR family regulator
VLIAEGRSFTHATAVVWRTQSAVSMRVRKLEKLRGKPLFRKAGRPMEMTEHGQFLLARPRGLVGMTDEIVGAFRALGHGICNSRRGAERTLERAGRRCRVAYLSNSQAGQHAAVLAGLAITVNAPRTRPPGLRVLSQAEGLPPLPGFSIALAISPLARQPLADALASHIAASLRAGAAADGTMAPAA